jgi:glycerol-3-phosphate acyltransferase PlsY
VSLWAFGRTSPSAPWSLWVWIAVVLIRHYVSLASISAAVAFPIALVLGILAVPDWHSASLWPLMVAAIVIPILVIVRHRENIRRLAAGTESKVRSRTSELGEGPTSIKGSPVVIRPKVKKYKIL